MKAISGSVMRLGKLTNDELKSVVLKDLSVKNKEVLRGGAIGEDCAAIQSDEIILVTTDPITAECENIGYLAIHVCANDIAAGGGKPFACAITILAHPAESVENIGKLMNELRETASSLGIDIIGGHTEFTDAVTRTIVSVTMLGKTKKFISSYEFRSGDDVYVIGNIGIEGTGILLTKYRAEFIKLLGEETFAEGVLLGKKISVLPIGAALYGMNPTPALHDITEGGVFGALAEVCEAAELGAEIYEDKIPLHDITRRVCEYLSLSPYGLISSGSMLCITGKGFLVEEFLKKEKIAYSRIGKVTDKKGVFSSGKNGRYEVFTKADELFAK